MTSHQLTIKIVQRLDGLCNGLMSRIPRRQIDIVLAIARRRQLYLLVGLPCLFYVVRAYRYISHPLFYAEDGGEWLAQAHNHPIASLLLPLNGFLHSFERATALLLNIVPLRFEPVAYAISALLIFFLLCYYLFSDRTGLFKTTYQRAYVCASLCLLPNVFEFFFNFANAVFLMGIVGACILVAKPSRFAAVRILEMICFTLLCFTLHFPWIYLLLLGGQWLFQDRRRYAMIAISAVGSIAQLIVHVFFSAPRQSSIALSDIPSRYTLLELYNQIIIPSFRFIRSDIVTTEVGRWSVLGLLVVSCLLALAVIVVAFVKASRPLCYIMIFLSLMAAAAIANPLVIASSSLEGLKIMATQVGASRYYIFGILLLFISYAILAEIIFRKQYKWLVLGIICLVGLLSSLQFHTFGINKHFTDYGAEYSRGVTQLETPGNTKPVKIHENPQGWYIILDR